MDIEAYVERAAALGMDPAEARKEAEAFKSLFGAAPEPAPCVPMPGSISVFLPPGAKK